MPAKQDAFLSAYKNYEQLLRERGTDAIAFENAANETGDKLSADRLRLCRQFRNYLSHVQDPGFIEPTDKMIKFLETQIRNMAQEGDTAKKHMKKPDACILPYTAKIRDANEKFQKLKTNTLLVQTGDGFKILSIFEVLGKRETTKIAELKLTAAKPSYCKPTDKFADLDPDRIWLCTDTGKPDGTLMGQIRF